MNKELIESIAALMENVTSDYKRGFIQGAHWVNQPRTWVGLTDEDISEIVRGTHNTGSFVRAIEAKLKEKNGA